MAISGDIRISIRSSTWRFRFHMSRLRFQLWRWELSACLRNAIRDRWDSTRDWLRPGLAPELNSWWCSPWLSRMAGRPVVRPHSFGMSMAMMGVAMARFADACQEAATKAGLALTGLAAAMQQQRANIRGGGGAG